MTNEVKKPLVQPLTSAQLEQMEGQPVYIQILQTGEGRWGLLESVGECVVGVLMSDGTKSYHLIDLYHKTWTAYAYPPPVHIDREAWEPCRRCHACSTCGLFLKPDAYKVCQRCTVGQEHVPVTPYCPHCGRPLTSEAWAELEKRLEKVKI